MTREQLSQLKQRVGKAAFTSRWPFDSQNRAACPFHGGNDGFTLWQKDGEWFATCRSGCDNKTWDAIAFVRDFDKLSFKDAVAKLLGKPVATPAKSEKVAAQRMTEKEWATWGRDVTPADIERMAKSRKDKTAGYETFRSLLVHWDDENKCISFDTVRDENGMQIFDRKVAQKKAKKVEKESHRDSEAAKLEAVVLAHPKASIRSLAATEKIGRNRIPNLLGQRGWKLVGDEWKKTNSESLPFDGCPGTDTGTGIKQL